MKKLIILMLATLIATSCSKANTPVAVSTPAGPTNVLVIINDDSAISKEVGAYYAEKRNIAEKYVFHIKCTDKEIIPTGEYQPQIEKPIREYLSKPGMGVDYIVLTKGVPIMVAVGFSVDSLLSCMDAERNPSKDKDPLENPYYGKEEHFSHQKFHIYLVTRLDGYTKEDAKALVDRALSARPQKGVFLLDLDPARIDPGYKAFNDGMRKADEILKARGFTSVLETTGDFVGKRNNLMGYCSWGSNDPKFDKEKYRGNRFLPGSIAETAVSSSARTFAPTEKGQSLIADLIKSGVTGVKGYCTEPTLMAIANPSILFDRYVSGYNLAESFYMASRMTYWKDIVVGDPLTSPYAK